MRVAIALLHYPVLDRQGEIVTTAITNLDLHDIARSAHTFGVQPCYVVHPIEAQRKLAMRIRDHWVGGSGARRIPDRSPAMGGLRIVRSLDDAIADFQGAGAVQLWTTSAKEREGALTFAAARERVLSGDDDDAVLLVFGTGWGLAPEVEHRATVRLEPIRSPRADGYNHLSVRAAAAIVFDRLLAPIREPARPPEHLAFSKADGC